MKRKKSFLIGALLITVVLCLILSSLNTFKTKKEEAVEKKPETEVVQKGKEKETNEQQVFFQEKKVEVDYALTPEEILATYTEKGMNDFKVNFPDTLSMNYALKNIGKVAPEITGTTMNDKKVSLSSLKGKKVIVTFSKTTCSICQEMAPTVDKIAKEEKDIVFLTVYPVDNNKDIKAYYKKLKLDVPSMVMSLEDNKGLKNVSVHDYQITQVPTYVFIDESGKISYTYIGSKDKLMFEDMIKTAFGQEKLYDNLRTVTIRVDENGNEIKEETLIDKDSVDHNATQEKREK